MESVNVASAVAFQAGETVLLGSVQTANAAASTLARTGDPVAAITAAAARAETVARTAAPQITSAVRTAAANIAAQLPVSSTSPIPHRNSGDIRHPSAAMRADKISGNPGVGTSRRWSPRHAVAAGSTPG